MKPMVDFLNKYRSMLVLGFIIISFPLIYAFVYYTGGIKYVFSHTMYVPILLTGAFFGFKYGLLAGLVGGIILGPLMPLVVETKEPQEFINWFYRMMIFIVIGGLSGYFVDKYKKIIIDNKKLFSQHPDTGIHNINYLLQLHDDYFKGNILIATILVNNKRSISEVLGTELYLKALTMIFNELNESLPNPSVVIQVDSAKFWIMFKHLNLNIDGKKIVDSLSKQIAIDEINIYVDYSIGVSEAKEFKQCKSLVPFRETDRLAGYAKANNLPYVIFDNDLLIKKYEFNLLGLFSNALKNNETLLMYQPVVEASTKAIIGLEALIRWDSPKHGLIMPNDFIPLVESTQLIHPMTEWVFRKAIRQQNRLIEEGIVFYISINLSIKNIKNPTFYQRMMEILNEEHGDAKLLIFEVTESVFLEEEKHTKLTLHQIKDAGFKIAIDDFGKGYSSLTYLSQFKTDYLKIDRSFISHIADKPSIRQIVQATIQLAHQFGLKVVAEGVETLEMFEHSKQLGIDYIQGFYIAKPMKEETVIDWYKNYIKK